MTHWLPALIFILILSGASAAENRTFHFGNRVIFFHEDRARGLLISASCPKTCQALQAFERFSREKVPNPSARTATLGARICKEAAGGKVTLGKDPEGNENAFCEFKDGSLLDTGSLSQTQTARGK